LRWLPGIRPPGEGPSAGPVAVRRWAALAGAVAFMFGDLFLTHVGNLNLIAVFSWLPLAFGLLFRALTRGRWGCALAAGVVVGLATLAGHLQMTLFTALALGFLAVWQGAVAWRDAGPGRWATWRPLGYLALCGAVAVGISALILLPGMELARHSARAAWGYSQTVEYSLSPPQLVGLLIPQFFGRGPAFHWSLWPRVEAGYVGVLTLVLAVAAWLFRRDRLTGMLTTLCLLALFLALGIYAIVHGWLTLLVPGLSQLRASARFVGLMDFGLAALAALGLDAILAVPPWEQPVPLVRLHEGLRKVALGVWLVPVPLAYLAVLLMQDRDPQIFLRASVALIGVVLFAVFLLASWGWLAALRARWVGPAGAGFLAVALIFLDLASNGAYMDLGSEDPSARFSAHPALVTFLQGDPDLFRIDTRTDIAQWWQPDAALLHRLQDVGGVANPLALADFQRYWEGLGGRSSRLYDLLNVKYVVAPRGAPMDAAKFQVAFDGDPDLVVYRNEGFLPRAFLVNRAISADGEKAWDLIHRPGFEPTQQVVVEGGPPLEGRGPAAGRAKVVAYQPNRMEVQVETLEPAYLVLSEVFYPGWRATVDGAPAPVYRANAIFRAVPVPAGEHRVVLVFSPVSWRAGVGGTLGTWAALGALGVAALARWAVRRKASDG
ncbi:MAG: YfhO family protein, partial [Anaerolineae bacterium]|nr:YfhO family protein [Anaerolineae bacterium]